MNADEKIFSIEHTDDYIHISLEKASNVLSSAVLNGGPVKANRLLNLKVSGAISKDPPDLSLKNFCSARNWDGTCVGMMTSASMNSFRIKKEEYKGVSVYAAITAGLSNAKRAGEKAEWRYFDDNIKTGGTINIFILSSVMLSPSAMAEALMISTEAKAAALQDMGVLSRTADTDIIATGTGTDSTAIVSGHLNPCINFCGKHVIFGEMIASAVIRALKSSLCKY